MKTLRILMFGLAAVLFTTNSVACVKFVQEGKTEQAAQSFFIVAVAIAVPAAASKQLNIAGVMGGGLTRAEEHLLAFLSASNKVDPVTAENYRQGKLRFVNFAGYIRKSISAASAGITVILDERDVRATGLCNIHQGKLGKGINAVVDRILVGYATTTTASGITDPKATNLYDSVISNFPAGLRSGELIVKQDGAIMQDPIPVSLCGSQADSMYSVGKLDSVQLNTPIVLEEQRQISIELDLPVASFGTNNHFVEIFLLGSKTKIRSDN
jgi:hypothetical protein